METLYEELIMWIINHFIPNSFYVVGFLAKEEGVKFLFTICLFKRRLF